MDQKPQIERPSFFEVERAWKALLQERKLPTECLWVFDENLCFEVDPARPGEFLLGIQTQFTP
ncbi:MAG TPA: hypothetical protein VN673_05245, partial [Clostridia bacterium]|nr:hypothetical protein [Clostridia bacterium]